MAESRTKLLKKMRGDDSNHKDFNVPESVMNGELKKIKPTTF